MSASYDSFEARCRIEGENRVHVEFNSRTSIPLSADIVLRLVVPHAPGILFTRARFATNVAAKYPIYDFPERTKLLETGKPNKDIRHRAGKDSYSSRVCLLRPVTAISNLKNFYFLRKLWEAAIVRSSLGGSLIKTRPAY